LLSSYQQEKPTGVFATSAVCFTRATGGAVGAALQWLWFRALCAAPRLCLERPPHHPAA